MICTCMHQLSDSVARKANDICRRQTVDAILRLQIHWKHDSVRCSVCVRELVRWQVFLDEARQHVCVYIMFTVTATASDAWGCLLLLIVPPQRYVCVSSAPGPMFADELHCFSVSVGTTSSVCCYVHLANARRTTSTGATNVIRNSQRLSRKMCRPTAF